MNGKNKILVVEDDKNIRHLISTLLEAEGCQTVSARDFATGKMLYFSHRPDLIILDLGLPDGDGTDLLREIRKDSLVPVIVLSARMDESDKVEALDLGANDYVTKPFGSAELMARVRSALRTAALHTGAGLSPDGKFTLDDLVIDYGARRVWIDQTEIKLTHTEFDILSYLSRCSGKVVTYSAIIKEIWGYSDSGILPS